MIRERYLWVVLLGVSVFATWWKSLPAATPVGVFVPTHVATEIKNVKKEDVPVKKIRAYPKSAKAKMGLPASEQQADNIYLVSASKLAADYRPRTVTAIYDSSSGEVRQDVRIDPPPWLAVESHGSVWLGVGVKNNGERVGRVEASYDVLQVKAFHLGGRATVDTDGAWFAGGGAEWRF